MLLAGVEAVRCTLCSTGEIQEAPGHIITWYFTIYDTWRKMPGMIAKSGPSRKLYPEREINVYHVNSHLELVSVMQLQHYQGVVIKRPGV